jgi:aspartyl aminopeptidase
MSEKEHNKKQSGWARLDEAQIQAAYSFSRGYLDFLTTCKTERETVGYIRKKAAEAGFKLLQDISRIEAGQKILVELKNKAAALVIIGQQPLDQGCRLIASHIDSPRLDLKTRPVYEQDGLGLFKTHYYGGIKKYQWLAKPLALHGVVIKKDGRVIEVQVGENPDDLVFTIADLLPHLAKDQMEKKMAEAVSGESLNAVIGSRTQPDVEKDPVKKAVLALLKEKYDIEEDDLTTAELQLVPNSPAREVGFDRSMVGGYGQDDRVSAYTSLMAVLAINNPAHTAICLFVDKEEIGSTGNTGLESLMIENLMAELMYKAGHNDYYRVRKALAASCAISADVNSAVDPNFPEVYDKMNCSFLGEGVVVTKYGGARGKADSNDANPEFVARIRKVFDDTGVIWQVGELGKVDIGGGGTVAKFMARYGMDVVDCGVAVLGMHSPFEVTSKLDIYMAYLAYKAFMQDF